MKGQDISSHKHHVTLSKILNASLYATCIFDTLPEHHKSAVGGKSRILIHFSQGDYYSALSRVEFSTIL